MINSATNVLEQEFFEFIYDRHFIYFKRFVKNLPPPWTDDPIMRDYKFCNVYRFLDKGTQYVYNRFKDRESPENILVDILYTRFFNLPNIVEDSLNNKDISEYFKDDYSVGEIREIISRNNASMFSDSYIITQAPFNRDPTNQFKGDKVGQVLLTLEDVYKNRFQYIHKLATQTTPQNIYDTIINIKLIGHFLAGQIILDLTYLGVLVDNSGNVYTNDDFYIVGPGADAGLDLMYPSRAKNSSIELLTDLRDTQSTEFDNLRLRTGKDFLAIADVRPGLTSTINGYLSAMDIQNCLCEFRKYKHWQSGKGKKRRFEPTTK